MSNLVAVGSCLVGLGVGCGADGAVEFGASPASSASPAQPDGGGAAAPGASAATCADGARTGDETDVDCGGACPACADGQSCAAAADCRSGLCTAGRCVAPRPDDGLHNGAETDVDCGGADTATPRCAVGKKCLAHSDCSSDGCNDRGLCALARSCTQLHGGDSCGAGETGQPDAAHESCCTSLELQRGDGQRIRLDKYKITAGRMRAFLERVGGNVKAAMDATPGWDATVEQKYPLPTNMDEALLHVGPELQLAWEWDKVDSDDPKGAAGCALSRVGARTYWQNDNPAIVGAEQHQYPKELLDEKMMNCAAAALFRAFCMWDGGDLAASRDLDLAWGPQKWPWGAQPSSVTALYTYDPRYVWGYNYGYPGDAAIGTDQSYFVPPPGRRPAGAGPLGHLDVAGGMHEWVLHPQGGADMWANGSWEKHPMAGEAGKNPSSQRVWNRRYYAIGARCVRPVE